MKKGAPLKYSISASLYSRILGEVGVDELIPMGILSEL
jgi:hypothetical protein